MTHKRFPILLMMGCCCLLTCQTTQQLGFNQTCELPGDPLGTAVGSAPNVPFEIDDLARRTVTQTRRIDARLARMAVSSVATGDAAPLLRLDTILIGACDWIASSFQHCGLDVRRVEEFILVKSPQSGPNPRNLRVVLREALPQIYAAIDRVHDNLAGQPTIGYKAAYGALDYAIRQRINALTPHLAAGLARRAE